MNKKIIKIEIGNLERALLEAEHSGIKLNMDYEKGTEGYKIQRMIHKISRNLHFYIAGELDQDSFDRLLSAMKKSVEILEGGIYGEYQRDRLVMMIRIGLMQTDPKLEVLENVKEYIPEAMLGIESFL